MTTQPMIHIGMLQDKAAVEAVADALVRILETNAEQKTIRAALAAFSHTAEVKNVRISHCTIGAPADFHDSGDVEGFFKRGEVESDTGD